MSRRRIANPLALAVLGCLSERPMHPYEISTTLRTRGKERSIKLNYGSLYSVVESLQKHRLISPLEVSREGRRPERTTYEITDEGRVEFASWLAELLSTPVRDFTSLEAGLSLMPGLPPDEVARLLEDRSVSLRMELAGLVEGERIGAEMQLPELFSVESSFRHAMLTAELTFVTDLAARIRAGTFGGTSAWRRMHELQAEGVPFEKIFADPVAYLGEEGRALQNENSPAREG